MKKRLASMSKCDSVEVAGCCQEGSQGFTGAGIATDRVRRSSIGLSAWKRTALLIASITTMMNVVSTEGAYCRSKSSQTAHSEMPNEPVRIECDFGLTPDPEVGLSAEIEDSESVNFHSNSYSLVRPLVDFSKFSKDQTGISPAVVNDQQIQFLKASGQGKAIWYAVKYNQVQFLIVEFEGVYPARVISPSGAIVDINSPKTRKYKESANVFATVTTPEGRYFMITDSVWQKMQAADITENMYSPPVLIENGRAMIANRVAFTQNLENQILKVVASSIVDDFFRAVPSDGTGITDVILTSARGYKRLSIDSLAYKGKQDVYRVCVFCLLQDSEINGRGHLKSKIDIEAFISDENLEQIFWARQHQVGRNIFIPDNYPSSQYFLVPLENGQFYSLSDENINKIIELQLSGKLNRPWVTEKDSFEILTEGHNAPTIYLEDKIYRLNLRIAKRVFIEGELSDFEPVLSDFMTLSINQAENDPHRIRISDEDLNKWFLEGQKLPGLFLKQNSVGVSHSWPFVILTEDHVECQYFLNVKIVKVVLSLTPENAIDVDEEVTQFIKARESALDFELSTQVEVNLASRKWAGVMHNDKHVFLSPNHIKALYKLDIKGVFEHADNLKSLDDDHHLLTIDDKEMVFNVNQLKRILVEGSLDDNELENSIRHMLKEPTVSKKVAIKRTIHFDLQTFYVGTCEGSFVNETVCEGTFKGVYHHATNPKKDDSVSKGGKFEFECDGTFDRNGCTGDLQFETIINSTNMSVQSTGYSPLSIGESGSGTILTLKTSEINITVNCSTTYNLDSQACVGAAIFKKELLDNGRTSATNKVYCTGSLDLTNLECASAELNTFQCLEPIEQENPDICGDRYIRRRCKHGGDFDGCYVSTPKDKEVICMGGIFNGSVCMSGTKAVSGPDGTYFTSSFCDGSYTALKMCDGKFSGEQIKCKKGDVVIENDKVVLCEEYEVIGAASCKGKLTENGCVGEYTGVLVFNGTYSFAVVAKNVKDESFSDFPGSDIKAELVGYTSLDESITAQWNSLLIECKKGLLDSQHSCEAAEITATARDKLGWRHSVLSCKGNLKYDKMSCEDSEMTIRVCESDYSTFKLPECEGTYKQFSCLRGGDFKGCKVASEKTGEIECKNGHWDGKICKEKEMIIPLNETIYYVGTCDGKYEEHLSCTGVFYGREVECTDSLLAADSVCSYKDNSNFICRGFTNKHGCNGAYDGYIVVRTDLVRVQTTEHSKVNINGKVTESETILNFVNSTYPADQKVKLGVDREFKAICKQSFNPSTRECDDAHVNITNDYTPNSTYIRARCSGIFNLETLECSSGQFSYYSCNGSQTFPDNSKCKGIYAHMDCRNGGTPSRCHKKTDDDVEIYCDGSYSEGFCKPFHLPQLPIIMVNNSYYIIGSCSSRIADNECKGIFTGSKVVTCSSDQAIHNQTIFDNCKPIANELFGTCVGQTGQYGCKGQYKIELEINSSIWDFKSSESSVYNFETVSGTSKLTKRNRGYDDTTNVVIACQSEFNLRSLKCNKTILQFVDTSYSEQAPGMAQTISAICPSSSYDIKNLACRDGEYVYYDCIGKSHKYINKEKGVKFSCLGDLTYSRCTNGGHHNECFSKGENDYTSECINSYFDGDTCLKDKSAENTKISITSMGSYTTTDTDGQEVTIESFEVDKFHIFGATANLVSIRENMIDHLKMQNGTIKDDQSITGIHMDQNPTKMLIDEGVLHKIGFQNFALDELPLRDFAVNDNAQFIRVLFKNMIIHQFMFSNLTTSNSVIRRLEVSHDSVLKDYGVEEMKIAKGFGSIQLRDVELYLPYIKNEAMDSWLGNEENKISLNLRLPQVEGIQISPFKIILDNEEQSVFFEFPELLIEDRSLDLIELTDFILQSQKFTSNPVAAEEVVRNYEQYIREHPNEKNDVADFSFESAEDVEEKLRNERRKREGHSSEDSSTDEIDAEVEAKANADFDLKP